MTADRKDSGPDQRQFPRSPMMLKVEYSSTNDFFTDYTENISGGGVFIATTSKFDLGQEIDFAISFPGLLDPIQVKGEIKWRRTEADEEGPIGIGVQFIMDRSPSREALANLLNHIADNGDPSAPKEPPREFRVLLVEDNVVVRDMFRYGIQKMSQRGGFPAARIEIDEADNGKEAWEILNSKSIHLVVVDLYMPVMDGGQLIELIRGDEKLKSIPVLVVSSGGKEGRMKAIQSRADVYLDKPIKLKQMMETIETLIAIGHSPTKI